MPYEKGTSLVGVVAIGIALTLNLDLDTISVLFGLFVAGIMCRLIVRHAANQREFDSVALFGESHL